MRTIKEATVGGTLHAINSPVEPLPGFQKAKPMVFAGVYPMDQSEHTMLRSALDKLLLNDSSVESKIETRLKKFSYHINTQLHSHNIIIFYYFNSAALGHGWRLGFLGVLHMDVFNQRLEQEYGAQIVLTAPNVPVRVKIVGSKNIKAYGSDIVSINNPASLPDPNITEEMYEPFVLGTIITPGTLKPLKYLRRQV